MNNNSQPLEIEQIHPKLIDEKNKNIKVLIVGCGAIGSQLATILAEDGFDVTGLKRTPLDSSSNLWSCFIADIADKQDLKGLSKDFNHVYFIVSPKQRGEEHYKNVYQLGLSNLLNHFSNITVQPSWIFVSSTSVYGQSQGEWVDEYSIVKPKSATAKIIREAEQLLLESIDVSTVVRFSGIYGEERLRLIKMAKTNPTIQHSPPYYTNRVHELDCIAALRFLLLKRIAGNILQSCYLVTDDLPVSQWDIMSWIAEKMLIEPPIKKPQENNVEMNKRCSNKRIKALGYHFLYSNFKDGYREILGDD